MNEGRSNRPPAHGTGLAACALNLIHVRRGGLVHLLPGPSLSAIRGIARHFDVAAVGPQWRGDPAGGAVRELLLGERTGSSLKCLDIGK